MINALCPCAVTFKQRNAIEQTRGMNRTGREWELIEPDLERVPDHLWVKDPGWKVEVWCVVLPFLLTFAVFCRKNCNLTSLQSCLFL